MVGNFKIVVKSNNETKRTFIIIKPYLATLDNFKEEIFMRMPQLKNKPLEYHYEGQLMVFYQFFLFSVKYLCDLSNFELLCFETIVFIDAEGDQITIFNYVDFGIFLEQNINKMFVTVPSESGTSPKQRPIEIEPKRILNQNELKVLRDQIHKIIDEKFSKPISVSSLESKNKMLKTLITPRTPLEPSHDIGTFTLNLK